MSPQTHIDERGHVHGVNPGTELGRYTLESRIEEIRGGERWTARDSTLERDVSLLVMPIDAEATDAALDAARRAANVEAPQLVRILDVGSDGNEYSFIAEDGVSGSRTLGEVIGTDALPAEEVRRITGEIATGVEAARARGLHHLGLSPEHVLLTPDGRIKVRGLATTAALAGLETEGEEADREDARAIVALAYAGLTATWPLEDTTSLPATPREGGEIPPPSRGVVGVPGDLDTICRETLVEGRGPDSPGDYAAQIAPWSRIPLAGAVRSSGGADESTSKRGDGEGRSRSGSGSDKDADRGATGAAAAGAGAAGAAAGAARGGDAATGSATGSTSDEPETSEIPVQRGDPTTEKSRDEDGHEARRRGAAAAAAAAGAVGTAGTVVGDRLGKAAKTAQERSRQRIIDARLRREAIRADQRTRSSLGAAPVSAELEAPAPMLPTDAGASPSRSQSNLVVLLMVCVVLVACVGGAFGVTKIGDGSQLGEILAGNDPVAGSTPSSSPSATGDSDKGDSDKEDSSGDGNEPFAILGAVGYDPDGDTVEHNAEAPLVYDGDPDTMWQTEGYEASSFVLKSGAGVTVDLGQTQDVSSVTLELPESLDGTVYVADGPTHEQGELGSFSNESGEVTIDTDDAIQGRYVTVWFTSLAPDDDGRYRASLSEITVR